MPAINVYLPEELFELVKPNKSKIIQQALKEFQLHHPPLPSPTPPDTSPSLPDDAPSPRKPTAALANPFMAIPIPIEKSG